MSRKPTRREKALRAQLDLANVLKKEAGEELASSEREVEKLQEKLKKLEAEIGHRRSDLTDAHNKHNAIVERLQEITRQIRQIPVDADRDFILRAVGVVEGMVTELSNSRAMLYQEVVYAEPGRLYKSMDRHRDLHDHRFDAAPYWMQRKV